jgi:hypothetical protein
MDWVEALLVWLSRKSLVAVNRLVVVVTLAWRG